MSSNMGPPALTESVLHSASVAKVAPFMPLFKPNKMYDPKTASALLAITMVADIRDKESLSHPDVPLANPMHLLAEQAWHGGGWNAPYTTDSTGVAAYTVYVLRKCAPFLGLAVVAVLLAVLL